MEQLRVPITKKMLIDWGGARVYRDAELLVDNGRVLEAVYEPPRIQGSLLWNNRQFKTSLRMLPMVRSKAAAPAATIPIVDLSVPMSSRWESS